MKATSVDAALTIIERRQRREKVSIAVISGFVGCVLTIVSGVATTQINDAIQAASRPKESVSAPCPTIRPGTPTEGNDYIEAFVSEGNANCWRQTLDSIRVGDQFQMMIQYANHTKVQQNGVVLLATLPKGFEYVAGSTMIANSITKGKYESTADGITSVGFNVGSFQPKGNVYMKFKVAMTGDVGRLCNIWTWALGANAKTGAGSSWASAGIVSVNPSC